MNTPTRKPDDYYFDEGTVWGNESKRKLAACLAHPSSRQLRKDLEWAEKQREAAYERARARWQREQELEERDRWLEYAAPQDTVFDTMSGRSLTDLFEAC